MTEIHSTAVVEDGAELGRDVRIGAFSYVSGEARVEEGTRIGPRVTVANRVRIGPDNEVHAGAVLGTDPQDRSYEGEPTGLRLGSGNVLREYVTMNRATDPDRDTVVGDGNMFMAYSHVAHDCRVGDDNDFANGATLSGHVTVGDHVTISGFTGVHQFARVGSCAMIGGMSRLRKDVVPYAQVSGGDPVKIYGINSVGLKRQGFDGETRTLLKRAFKRLFRDGYNTSQALRKIREELPAHEAIDHLVQFVEASERGIHK